MNLVIVGINHTTAPVSLREKVAFAPDALGLALHDLRSTETLDEVAILSTCNRTEIYAIAEQGSQPRITQWLADYHKLPFVTLSACVYMHTGPASIKHLLRVAAGLDSMVLGEPQILGQVKDAFLMARQYKTMGPQLEQLSQKIYRVAKQIRSSTAIGQNPVSVASIAVDLAAQLFADLATCNVLLIGAGETIELVGRHLNAAKAKRVVIANRTAENARRLADILDGEAVSLADIPNQLIDSDIVIASTGSQLPILGKGTVERALKQRRHKPIFMVDLAVPRDIEPEIGTLADVYLYSIDDLEQIIAENIGNRMEAARDAEAIIDVALADIRANDQARADIDVLLKFRKQHEAIKQAELEKALQRLGKGDAAEEVVVSLANQLTNKIMHTPSIQLKQASTDGRQDLLRAISHLFQLEEDQS
jgi:glutamyl-tRNA reductase